MKPGKQGIPRIIDATSYSIKGLRFAWKSEAAFREEIMIGPILIIAAFFLGDNSAEIALMVMSYFLVLIVEILNSAIEAVVDRIGTEKHELSGAAKDMGSAAVMLSIGQLIVVWLILLLT